MGFSTVKMGLNKKLLILIIAISTLVLIPLVALQTFIQYQKNKESIRIEMNEIVESYDSILAEGLYKLDAKQLRIALDAIAGNDAIVKAMVTSDSFGLSLASRHKNHNLVMDYSVKKQLTHFVNKNPFRVGMLELQITFQPVVRKMQDELPQLVAFLFLNVFLVSVFIMFVINLLLVKPVVELSARLSSMDPDSYEPIYFERLLGKRADEFTVLINNINARGVALQSSNQKLNSELDKRKQNQARIINLAQKAEVANIASSVLHNSANALMIASLVPKKILKKIFLFRENYKLLSSKSPVGKNSIDIIHINRPNLVTLLDSVESGLSKMDKSLQIAGDLIRSQQNNANTASEPKKEIIKSIVDDVLVLKEDFLKANKIKVRRPEIPKVEVFVIRFQIANVLVNVIKNAVEAMKEAETKSPMIKIDYKEEVQYFLINIKDNGIGIDPNNIATIEKGSFTTKEDGHGFGFSSCKRIMQSIGGDLTIESSGIGLGANVNIRIPKHQKPANLRDDFNSVS